MWCGAMSDKLESVSALTTWTEAAAMRGHGMSTKHSDHMVVATRGQGKAVPQSLSPRLCTDWTIIIYVHALHTAQ